MSVPFLRDGECLPLSHYPTEVLRAGAALPEQVFCKKPSSLEGSPSRIPEELLQRCDSRLQNCEPTSSFTESSALGQSQTSPQVEQSWFGAGPIPPVCAGGRAGELTHSLEPEKSGGVHLFIWPAEACRWLSHRCGVGCWLVPGRNSSREKLSRCQGFSTLHWLRGEGSEGRGLFLAVQVL